ARKVVADAAVVPGDKLRVEAADAARAAVYLPHGHDPWVGWAADRNVVGARWRQRDLLMDERTAAEQVRLEIPLPGDVGVSAGGDSRVCAAVSLHPLLGPDDDRGREGGPLERRRVGRNVRA